MPDWFKSATLDVKAGDVGSMAQKNARLHADLLEQYGDSPMAVGWSSSASQRTRFDRMYKELEYTAQLHPSILDVGCGRGDLAHVFQSYGWRGVYCGIDVNAKVVDVAMDRRRLLVDAENVTFAAMGLSEFVSTAQPNTKFDVVVGSGVFGLAADPAVRAEMDFVWQRYVLDVLRNMRTMARDVVIVNFLSVHGDEQDKAPGMAYVSPGFLLDMLAETFGPRLVLHHDDRTNDFTVTMPMTPFPRYKPEGEAA